MPLIIIAGFPSSGKTVRANQIKEYFENTHKIKCILVNEESIGLNKQFAFKGQDSI